MQYKLSQAIVISLVALLLVGCASPTPWVIVVTPTPESVKATSQPATATPMSKAAPSTTPEPTVIVTTQKGDKFQVSYLTYVNESYLPNKVPWGLPLKNGLTVDFEKMRSFEVIKVESGQFVVVEITLLDGKTMTDQVYLASNMILTGKTDIGTLRLLIDQVKRVDFQR